MSIEEDQIRSVENRPELKSVREIRIFLNLANFHRRFIKGFSKIATPRTELTKTSLSSRDINSSIRVVSTVRKGVTQPRRTKQHLQRDTTASRGTVRRDVTSSRGTVQGNAAVAFRGTRANDDFKGLFVLTPEAKLAFEELKTTFTTAPVLKHFDPELPIRAETDASGYAIGSIPSRLHRDV